MFNSIKRLKELSNPSRSKGENVSEIKIYCNDKSDVLSPFCGNENSVINSDLADYLENKADQLPIANDIHITIEGETKETDKQVIKCAITNYYENKLADTKREFKKNGNLTIVFLILAIIVLSAAVIINTFMETRLILHEIVYIVGWVFASEAAELFFLQRGALRIKQIRYLNFIRAELE